MKNLPIDKQTHFWWGWAIAATLFPLNVWFAIFMAAFIGACKEMWDAQGHGTPDIWDFAATAFGGSVGALCGLFVAWLAA